MSQIIGPWLENIQYGTWNTAVAALQFWTTDLKTHVLSSTIEEVYSAFFYTTSMHLLCQQSEEFLFGHFMTTLNAAFESKLTLEDEGYESGSENFNISTPLRCTSKNTMFPAMTTSSLTPPPHIAQVPASHATNLYDTSYPSIALMMKTFLQLTLHHLPTQYHCRTLWIFHRGHIPSAP